MSKKVWVVVAQHYEESLVLSAYTSKGKALDDAEARGIDKEWCGAFVLDVPLDAPEPPEIAWRVSFDVLDGIWVEPTRDSIPDGVDHDPWGSGNIITVRAVSRDGAIEKARKALGK